MQYNVAQLLKAPTGATRHYAVDVLAEELEAVLGTDEMHIRSPAVGEVDLMHTTDGILVTGHLETTIELLCDRCLDAFEVSVELEIEETFRPSIDIRTGAGLPPVAGEERETLIDEHHILDLTEVVRQGILLAVPMHPVCRQDCAGLCPQCGQNLNAGQCDCEVEVIDPRWSELQALLDESTRAKVISNS